MRPSLAPALLALVLTCCSLIPVPGCAGAIPIFTKAITIADQVLPWIELADSFLDTALDRAGASAETRADVDRKVDAVRKSSQALRELAQLGEAASAADLERTTREFKESWVALASAGKAFGLEVDPLAMLPPQDGRMAAAQGERLAVPPAERLVLEAQ
jgi:hypothetical protein